MSKSLRLGIFVAATLAIFSAGVFWIGGQQFLFTRTYRLNAEFPNVAGLTQGAAVRVGGIHEGTVKRIILPPTPDQKVRVEMDLKGDTRNVIKQDSVAAIQTEGLVGDQYVEIAFGSPNAPPVKNGDTVNAEPPLQVSDMIRKTNAILDSAKGAVQNVTSATANLSGVAAKINQGRGTVGELVNDRSVYQHVSEAAANLQDDTEALKHNFLLRGFFKKRGYEDESQLTRNAVAQLPAGTPARSFTYPAGKLFDKSDGTKLKNGKTLDEAGRFLEQSHYGLVVVAAYADMKGDSEKARQTTEARAAAARSYLVEHFKLDDTRVKTMGAAKSESAPDGGSLDVLIYGEQGSASRGGK